MSAERRDWAVRHKLEEITTAYRFVGGELLSCTLAGRASTKRAALWILVIGFDGYETEADFVHDVHSLLCSLISAKPGSQSEAQNVMLYGSVTWNEQQLPWDC